MSGTARRYTKALVGGTFDTLHAGHKRLLQEALDLGDTVVIGVTTDAMAAKTPKIHSIDNYDTRVSALEAFLEEQHAKDRVVITPLENLYGPAVTDGAAEVLVVSRETAARAREINQLRRGRGLKPVKIRVIEMVVAEDGAPISTTRIRHGEITREGDVRT